MKRAVFLDRDGVLNRAPVRNGRPFAPETPDEVEIFPDAAGALHRLKAAGFLLLVVTNQPDVARGTRTRAAVEQINELLAAALPLDGFYTCCHDDPDGCACRKPKPGLLLEAASAHDVDPRLSFLVGDRWRDIDAGAAAGCRTVLIERGYEERAPAHPPETTVHSLAEAAAWILREATSGTPTSGTPGNTGTAADRTS